MNAILGSLSIKGARSASGLEYSVQSAIVIRIRRYQSIACGVAVRRRSYMTVSSSIEPFMSQGTAMLGLLVHTKAYAILQFLHATLDKLDAGEQRKVVCHFSICGIFGQIVVPFT